MGKNTFSFRLFTITLFTLFCGTFSVTNAQEADFIYGDEVSPEIDRSSEYLIPDTPYTEDDKSDKKKKSSSNKTEVKESATEKNPVLVEEVHKSKNSSEETTPLGNPAEPSTTPVSQDNPLSFNFLYYIIQKFKFADVIDQ